MKFSSILIKEILYHKIYITLSILSRIFLVSVFISTGAFINIYDQQAKLLADIESGKISKAGRNLEDSYRKGTLKYSYNLIILSCEESYNQWINSGESTFFFDDSEISKLANSKLIWTRHLMPLLQQSIFWKEQGHNIYIIGTKGEMPSSYGGNQKSLISIINPGEIFLGYQIALETDSQIGDSFLFNGKEYKVAKIQSQRGNRDDLSIWLDLKEVQTILNLPNQVNATMALECVCASENVLSAQQLIQEEVQKVLPGFKVVTMSKRAISRRELRSVAGQKVNELNNALLLSQIKESKQRKRNGQYIQLISTSLLVLIASVLLFNFSTISSQYFSTYKKIGFSKKMLSYLLFVRTLFISLLGLVGGLILAFTLIYLFLSFFTLEINSNSLWNPLTWFPFGAFISSILMVFFLDVFGILFLVLRSKFDD